MTKTPTKTAPDLISRAELARRKGVNRSTATRACNGVLADAVVADMVDASHPAVLAWLGLGGALPAPSEDPAAGGEVPTREDFSWVTYRRRLAEAERLESRNERDAGRLISRELVRKHIFGGIEELTLRLLRDVPITVARRVGSAALAGMPQADLAAIVRNINSSVLEEAKRKVLDGLDAAKTGNNPPPVAEFGES